MAAAGWYPDPEGRPDHVRYWDGSAWQGAPTPRAGAGVPPTPTPGSTPPWRRWAPLLALIVAVALVAVVWSTWQRNTPIAQDTTSSRPTGSVWNETERPTPTTPPPPTASHSQGSTVECPRVTNKQRSHPSDGRVHGGGLSFGVPEGWKSGGTWSRVLTDQAGASRHHSGSTWSSLLTVGIAPHASGFEDPRTTAIQIFECHVSSGNFPGYLGRAVVVDEAITVDGKPGHWVRGHAESSDAPGGGATYDMVVLDLGDQEGLSVFWGGVVDADAKALADLDVVREGLRVG